MYSFPCHSKAEIMHKYKVNAKYYVASRPEINALSNGALVFPVSLVLTGKNGG
jgi:hypothetical protein